MIPRTLTKKATTGNRIATKIVSFGLCINMTAKAATTVRMSRIAIVTTLVTDSATISTLYVMRDSNGPVLRSSKNRAGKVRNLRNTPRRSELMTLRPMKPSEDSVAYPATPRAMKIRTKATGIHLAASRFCLTRASSMSGCSR